MQLYWTDLLHKR